MKSFCILALLFAGAYARATTPSLALCLANRISLIEEFQKKNLGELRRESDVRAEQAMHALANARTPKELRAAAAQYEQLSALNKTTASKLGKLESPLPAQQGKTPRDREMRYLHGREQLDQLISEIVNLRADVESAPPEARPALEAQLKHRAYVLRTYQQFFELAAKFRDAPPADPKAHEMMQNQLNALRQYAPDSLRDIPLNFRPSMEAAFRKELADVIQPIEFLYGPIPADAKQPEVFNAEDPAWADIEELYRRSVEAFAHRKSNEIRHLSPEEADERALLGKRYLAGDPTAQFLINLGWREGRSATGQFILEPPRSFSEFLTNYRRLINEAIARGEIQKTDVIEPAVVFVRPRGGVAGNPDEYLFVRPLIDPPPQPGQGWFPQGMVRGSSADLQLSHMDWQMGTAAGRMPISLHFSFISHDLAHLVEFAQRPALMKATRDNYAASEARPAVWHAALQAATLGTEKDTNAASFWLRTYMFAEVGSVPDPGRAPEIRSLMRHLFEPNGPKTVAEEAKRLADLAPPARDAQIDRFLSSYKSLIFRQGGNSRDPYSTVRFGESARITNGRALTILEGKSRAESLLKFPDSAREESLMAIGNELERLVDMRRNWNMYLPDAQPANPFRLTPDQYAQIKDLPAPVRNARLEAAIDDYMARLEMAFHAGVVYGVTPEGVARDSMGVVIDTSSPTCRYYSAFAFPGSASWSAFVSPSATVREPRFNGIP